MCVITRFLKSQILWFLCFHCSVKTVSNRDPNSDEPWNLCGVNNTTTDSFILKLLNLENQQILHLNKRHFVVVALEWELSVEGAPWGESFPTHYVYIQNPLPCYVMGDLASLEVLRLWHYDSMALPHLPPTPHPLTSSLDK